MNHPVIKEMVPENEVEELPPPPSSRQAITVSLNTNMNTATAEERVIRSPTLKLLVKQSVVLTPRNISPDIVTPNDNEILSPLVLKSKLDEMEPEIRPVSIKSSGRKMFEKRQ